MARSRQTPEERHAALRAELDASIERQRQLVRTQRRPMRVRAPHDYETESTGGVKVRVLGGNIIHALDLNPEEARELHDRLAVFLREHTQVMRGPQLAPMGVPVGTQGIHDAWEAVIAPWAEAGPQSVEQRTVMAVMRWAFEELTRQEQLTDEGTDEL